MILYSYTVDVVIVILNPCLFRKGDFLRQVPIPKLLETIKESSMPVMNGKLESSHNEPEDSNANGQVPNGHLPKESPDRPLYRQDSYSEAINAVFVTVDSHKSTYDVTERNKFPTSFWTQLSVLSRRSFRQARPDILSKLDFIQVS